ncbi:MAG: response regulator [Desulfobulbaceae bacterium]|nr:response regulator [Desulfobulbaceae bacterium]
MFNILVVDDSETMRAAIRKVVGMSGVPVGEFLEAGNGMEALAVLEDAWVDVILTDINMPEMNGIEFLKRVKAEEVYRNIPVIIITTEASQARMDEAEGLGASGYVKKPFLPETIKMILTDVLEKAYAQRMKEIPAEAAVESDEEMDF